MKDLKRLLIYGGTALFSILLLVELASAHVLTGNAMVGVAVFLVIVLPAVIAIKAAKRERQSQQGHDR